MSHELRKGGRCLFRREELVKNIGQEEVCRFLDKVYFGAIYRCFSGSFAELSDVFLLKEPISRLKTPLSQQLWTDYQITEAAFSGEVQRMLELLNENPEQWRGSEFWLATSALQKAQEKASAQELELLARFADRLVVWQKDEYAINYLKSLAEGYRKRASAGH